MHIVHAYIYTYTIIYINYISSRIILLTQIYKIAILTKFTQIQVNNKTSYNLVVIGGLVNNDCIHIFVFLTITLCWTIPQYHTFPYLMCSLCKLNLKGSKVDSKIINTNFLYKI